METSVIDPGHGGHQATGHSTPYGARGPGGTLEKDVTLHLARRVAHHLGSSALLTRTGDINLSLSQRTEVARRSGAGVFLSLHANQGHGAHRGAEAYVHPRANPASRALALSLQRALARLGGPADGGVKSAELAVLSPTHHAPRTAACLLEVDYLSSAEGERRLRQPAELDRLGRAIALAIREHTGHYGRTAALEDPADGGVIAGVGDPPADTGPSTDGGSPGVITLPEIVITGNGNRVSNSNIVVAGKHFVDWFNTDFKPTQPGTHPTLKRWGKPAPKFPDTVNKTNFQTAFDHCADFWAPQLTLNEFLTFFCIFYNETGGSMVPVSEMGSARYMFESTSGGKASYNQSPNRKAGDQLLARGYISPDDVAAWNSTTTYPNPSDETLKAQARECDFFKYRGRGLIQLTWRDAYQRVVDPLLTANGYNVCDDLTEAELGRIIRTDPRIYLPMVKGFFRRISATFANVNREPPNWTSTGNAVAGGSAYGPLLQWRCETLLAAMEAAGFETDAVPPATSQGLAVELAAASSPDLLDFQQTSDTLDSLSGNPEAFRQKVVDTIEAFNGFGHGDTPAGRRAAYGDIIAYGEAPAMRASLLQKTTANSSCGLAILGAWRLLGARGPLIDPPYRPGTVIANLLAYARQSGALRGADSIDQAQAGDVIYLGKAVPDPANPGQTLYRQHIFTVTRRDGDTFYSVDGGQIAPLGSGLDDGGCNGIRKRVRTLAPGGRLFLNDDRPIVNWVDITAVRFTDPIIQPLRNPSGNTELIDPDAT